MGRTNRQGFPDLTYAFTSQLQFAAPSSQPLPDLRRLFPKPDTSPPTPDPALPLRDRILSIYTSTVAAAHSAHTNFFSSVPDRNWQEPDARLRDITRFNRTLLIHRKALDVMRPAIAGTIADAIAKGEDLILPDFQFRYFNRVAARSQVSGMYLNATPREGALCRIGLDGFFSNLAGDKTLRGMSVDALHEALKIQAKSADALGWEPQSRPPRHPYFLLPAAAAAQENGFTNGVSFLSRLASTPLGLPHDYSDPRTAVMMLSQRAADEAFDKASTPGPFRMTLNDRPLLVPRFS